MATPAFHNITSTDTRPHPYSIASSYSAFPVYESYSGDTRPSTNSYSTPSTPSSFRATPPHLATRITSTNLTRPRKPFWRLPTVRTFGCMGSSHIDDDHSQLITDARITDPIADVDEHDSRQSFFDGMSEVHSRKSLRRTRSKRTPPVADTSPKPTPFRSASIRDHLTTSPKVEPLQNEKPYHYQKRSAISFHSAAIGEPSPDERTLEVTKRRAGALDIAIRAIESASYLPSSTGGTSTPDGSSGSLGLPAFDDLDSVSSESIYSPIYSPIEYMNDQVEQRAPEDVFKQRLLKRSVSFKHIKLSTPPLTPLRSQMVSFSRPTQQVYPYLICQASARQDSPQQVTHRSPTNSIHISVPLRNGPAPDFAPLSPPAPPNRNPKRTPSDSGHGPLIHATLDRPFPKEGQVKSSMFTPGPRTIVLNRPAPSPSSGRREPLPSFGKRF